MGWNTTWLFSDISLHGNRELDPFFKEFFAFIFRSESNASKHPLICVNIDHLVFSRTPIDKERVALAHSYQRYQIAHGRTLCEIRLTPMTFDKHTALFVAGFAAYALKNDIEIQNSSFTDGAKCHDYFPTVTWLKENRNSEDYDYILGKLYDYAMVNDCLDKLLDFYDGLGDIEGKAEFLNYCGRHGQFKQFEMRL